MTNQPKPLDPFKALDDTRAAFKDVPDKELERAFASPHFAQRMSQEQIGLTFTIILASTTLVSLPAGKMGDSAGRRKTILISWAGESSIIYAFVFSLGPVMAIGAVALWAAFGALDAPAIQAWLADTTREHTRGISMGIFRTASSLVTVPIPLIVGFLYQFNAQFPFYLNSIISLSALAFLWRITKM